jgi:predicted CXXCH cytochrome family protein
MSHAKFFGVHVFLFTLPGLASAIGPHDSLNCTGCHGIHTAKGAIIFAVAPNQTALNPRTKQPFTGVTALCLACHETPDNGGMGILPISASHSHPFDVVPDPKKATVPDMALRDGKLECVSCHDPHPSNPNYKYLRVDTANGTKMPVFCAMCHRSKVDPGTPTDIKIFSSMDERK